jgi:hypothetical protein
MRKKIERSQYIFDFIKKASTAAQEPPSNEIPRRDSIS